MHRNGERALKSAQCWSSLSRTLSLARYVEIGKYPLSSSSDFSALSLAISTTR